MQNFDVLIMLALFSTATYFGVLKPTLEVLKMKDKKKEKKKQVRVVIDNLTQTEITLQLGDEELDESIVLAKTLQELTGGEKC
jgi:hypothetical protein